MTAPIFNPWLSIPPLAPYVLPDDKPYIDAYNNLLKEKDEEYRINLNYTPEPRLGSIDAPIILLQLNPSYDAMHKNGDPDLEAVVGCIASLHDEYHPHLGIAQSHRWWSRCFGSLIKAVGGDATLVANNVCSIEFFPYRSRKFSHGQIRIPSQQYTFSLVRRAIDRGAIFIVTRNLPLWFAAIPELCPLKDQQRLYVLKATRRTSISDKTLRETGAFDRIVEVIRSHNTKRDSTVLVMQG